LLGLALIVAAVCLVRPIRVPPAPVVARPLVAATIGVAKLALGDRTQFLTFAVAVEGSSPLLAGIGGAAGAIVVGISALLLGTRGWCRLPWRWINAAGALVLGAWGVTAALQGLRIF
jgi:putative Ca2+/H+ antiporter (TMEM165/GDT1 family)